MNTPGQVSDIQSAALSSPTGELLFYTNGCATYSPTDVELLGPLGFDAYGSCPPGQGWVFAPWPCDSNRVVGFHLQYTVGEALLGPSFQSFVFDRTLNGGDGDYVPGSMRVLMDSATFRLTLVPHTNGTDYWAITHQDSNDLFAAFRLSANGVDSLPVISHTGIFLPIEPDEWSSAGKAGPLIASYDGTQLAMLIQYTEAPPDFPMAAELYHFDASTGSVQHTVTLPQTILSFQAGVEFSPDGTNPTAWYLRGFHPGKQIVAI
ncbi:MAG: hypothetical protein IPP33_06035 [Flavobacteriales bacterium]|nr:hypothetical protein [Flavobacteriales bacterium]